MKFGDRVTIRDGSSLDGCIGIVYRLDEGKAVILLDKEVLWPVDSDKLEMQDKN